MFLKKLYLTEIQFIKILIDHCTIRGGVMGQYFESRVTFPRSEPRGRKSSYTDSLCLNVSLYYCFLSSFFTATFHYTILLYFLFYCTVSLCTLSLHYFTALFHCKLIIEKFMLSSSHMRYI